jgi:hypothetical protein
MAGTDNAPRDIVLFDRHNGGISQNIKSGGAFRWLRGIDIHEDPSFFKLARAAVKETGATVTGKPIGATRDRAGIIWVIEQGLKLYKRTTAAVWSNPVSKGAGTGNWSGIMYWDQTDTLYLPDDNGIYTYGRLGLTPALTAKYTTYIDQRATGTGQTYALTTGVNEGATHKWPFIPDQDGMSAIVVAIAAKGTGNWTITVHDDSNNVVATVTVANASLSNSTNNTFSFANQVRLQKGASYHLHITSSVADGTVVTGTASDLTNGAGVASADIDVVHDFLIATKSGLHPMLPFANFLIVCNANYISTYDGLLDAAVDANGQLASSWNLRALVFPAGYEAICIAQYDEYVAIGLEYRGTDVDTHSRGKIIFWDGFSSNYTFAIDVFEGGVTTLLTPNNRLQFVAGTRGDLFEYNGGDYYRVVRLPNTNDQTYVRTGPQSADIYLGMAVLGLSYEHDNTTFEHGVYTWGSKNSTLTKALSFTWPISTGHRTGTTVEIGFIAAFGTELLIGWKDGTDYGVDVVKPGNNYATEGVAEGLVYDHDALWHEKYIRTIRVDHSALAAGEAIQIKYKINREANWATGVTNDVDGTTHSNVSIKKKFKDLEYQVTVTGPGTTTPRVDSILYDIEPRKNSELP